jgi:hypothetical protein
VSSFIGGGTYNTITDSQWSTIGGGESNTISSTDAFIGAGQNNSATGQTSFVGSGYQNVASGYGAFVGAGNSIVYTSASLTSGQNNASGTDSFIGAGDLNLVSGNGSAIVGGDYTYGIIAASNGSSSPGNQISGTDSFVGAGDLNQITNSGSFIGAGGSIYAASLGTNSQPTPSNEISGKDSFIGAGDLNLIASQEAAITAGSNNTITGHGPYAALGGGQFNSIGSQDAFIGAGQSNSVTGADAAIVGGASNEATGPYASVGGGSGNIASGSSATVPGGYHNLASGEFSFAAGFGSYANRSGTFVWSDDNTSAPHLEPTAANQFIARATGGVVFLTNAAQTTGVKLAPGSGAWASASDRNLKRDVAKIDDAAVLAKVAALPVAEWSYTSERGVRHVGPMAQDFYAAFKVGEDDRHITSIDEDGVALASIKALNAKLEVANAGLRSMHRENAELHIRLATLEHEVHDLAARFATAGEKQGANSFVRSSGDGRRSPRARS